MMKAGIRRIEAREILDSRGNPTLSVTVQAAGVCGTFDVPSGTSTGKHEALELRDGDKDHFEGLGVLKAAGNIAHIIEPALMDMNALDQEAVDKRLIELDSTANKSKLGANAIIGVSIACAKAAAVVKNVEVYEHLRDLATMPPSRETPFLYMNLINGGLHAKGRLTFQEYHLVPQTDSVEEALGIGTKVMHLLGALIQKKYGPASANLGDEGGFAPDIEDVREPLKLLSAAAHGAGVEKKVKFALDAAASSFYKNGAYLAGGRHYSAGQLRNLYIELVNDFPLLSIEDPFMEEAFEDFAKLNGGSLIVVGDDLTVTNIARLKEAIEREAISGLIIKPNQIGTLSETIETMKLAREHKIECIVSHRSGETSDDFIADLAYAYGAFGLKAGAPQREERVVKYNRLLQIAENKK
jgi:enolase